MATSKITLHNALRQRYLTLISDFLTSQDEVALLTKSNQIAVPCVDAEGNDEYITITFSVPSGERGGDPYNGYAEAEAYAEDCKAKAEKAQETAHKKAEKAKRDAEIRKAKAEAKAKAKAQKEE